MRFNPLAFVTLAVALAKEVVVPLPAANMLLALSTRGPSSFRVRFIDNSTPSGPIQTCMVHPDGEDASFTRVDNEGGAGIKCYRLFTTKRYET